MPVKDIFVLSQKRFEGAKNLPVILFDYYDKEVDIFPYEALIFTSKNGVYALDQVNACWKSREIYSIGSGTSEAIRKLGGKIAYEAKSSYGDVFADEIKTHLQGLKTLFIRPKVVTSHLAEILRDAGVDLEEEILYETKCNDCTQLQKPPAGSYIIFSSPSTIDCFLRCFDWDASYTAIVIGEKTASFMPEDISYEMSPKQTIPACIALAQKMQNARNRTHI
ncbi:MAG TPA: uroporphyrinogen-III synthase [Campylobacteraceae bacterium]|nr:uroporphyrinogen-III synthase [Campylobacteraceae bacterium]